MTPAEIVVNAFKFLENVRIGHVPFDQMLVDQAWYDIQEARD